LLKRDLQIDLLRSKRDSICRSLLLLSRSISRSLLLLSKNDLQIDLLRTKRDLEEDVLEVLEVELPYLDLLRRKRGLLRSKKDPLRRKETWKRMS
jgi:hypothetical protein